MMARKLIDAVLEFCSRAAAEQAGR
jgi:hypothetical protein